MTTDPSTTMTTEELTLKTLLIVITIKNSLETNSSDVSLVCSIGSMPIRFKDDFESMIKVINLKKSVIYYRYIFYKKERNISRDLES